MDFTLEKYNLLLQTFKDNEWHFATFQEFVKSDSFKKTVVLRHDVDRLPVNALTMAKIENSMGIRATYYFRIVDSVWDEGIITSIINLGHEVGYHYEDLSLTQGNKIKAIEHFGFQLNRFRKMYPVKTICMHGSPLSKWDNRALWQDYDYHDFGINGEPYFDIDYNNVIYITDTGRAWNNSNVNVRDLVNGGLNLTVKTTDHLISMIDNHELKNQIIINTHPHRWFSDNYGWLKEYVGQNLKNIIKKILIKFK